MKSSISSAATAKRLIEDLGPDIIRLVSELVRTDTVAIPPHGKETAGQGVLAEFLRTYGCRGGAVRYRVRRHIGTPVQPPRPRLLGPHESSCHAAGAGRGRSLLFNAHMDTVPAGHGDWTLSPWSGEIREGRLYGRGSLDMKGGLAAQFGVLCALRKHGVRTGGDVTPSRWWTRSGRRRRKLAARLHGPQADACAIPEVTQLEVDWLLGAAQSSTSSPAPATRRSISRTGSHLPPSPSAGFWLGSTDGRSAGAPSIPGTSTATSRNRRPYRCWRSRRIASTTLTRTMCR